MGDTEFHQTLRAHLIRNFREIEHPADPYDASRMLPVEDVEGVTDVLLALLRLPTTVADARDVERRMLSAFEQYLSASALETERRVNAASSLVLLLEPFLKKLFALRHPTTAVPRRFRDLLKTDAAGYQSELSCRLTNEEFLAKLRSQPTGEAILHDAYCFRNIEAHEAKVFTSFQEQRYWRSVVAAFLLIADRNIDLIPDVRNRRESDARIRSGLRVCLANVRARFDDTRWRNEYYIHLNTDQGGKLNDYVDAFLTGQDGRLLVLAGRTGAGKSTFLERLATELADQALDALDLGMSEGLLIPVHLEVKRCVTGKRAYLVKKLYSEFDPNRVLGVRRRRVVSWPQILSSIGLIVFLDGLDEVRPAVYPSVVSEIEDLVSDFDNIKVIVTSRPHAVPDHWRESLVHIAPFAQEEVLSYFTQPERLKQLAPYVEAFLKNRPDFLDILQDPLMAESACRYWRQLEPTNPQKKLAPDEQQEALLEGPLLHHLYQCFFAHHLRRTFGKKVVDYERAKHVNALAKLALEMDGDPSANFDLIADAFARFETKGTASEHLLELFVDIGLLKSDNNEFAFRNDTVKAYFAAVGLRSRLQRRQDLEHTLSLIGQANAFWHRCVELLKQIAPLYDLSPVEGHLASLAEATFNS